MDTSLRVRDRYLAKVAVDRAYGSGKIAASMPPRQVTLAFVESVWTTRLASEKEAWGGISKMVDRLVGLFKHAPQAWAEIKKGLGLDDSDGLPAMVSRIRQLMDEGKRALGKAIHGLTKHFPLSLFFVDKQKMPGLTALLASIMQKVPWIRKALDKIHGTAEVVDQWFKRYIPTLRRPIYAAIFIYVWISVLELTWDIKDLIAGFTGGISLSQLLASMPESALGALIGQLGFGTFAALPVTLILRLAWLTAQRYLEYHEGKGFVVRWDRLGLEERPSFVPA